MNSHQTIREEVKKMVSRIIPCDACEEAHLDFVKNWLASDAEIFRIVKPDQPAIHLVSYFMVVDPSTREFLLVDHKKAQLWLSPGGHVEINENPKDTVKREVKEELGIVAEFLFEEPLFLTVTETVGDVPRHIDVSFWYLLKGHRQEPLTFDAEEFHQIRWFRWDEIPFECADPHMKRFVDKVVKKIVNLHGYEVSAKQYAKNTAELHPQAEAQKFMNTLPPHGKILDIGCGPGRDAKVFSDAGYEVVGIDLSPNMVEAAKQNVPKGTFVVMDIEAMDFPKESFDGIWASCVLLHVPKKSLSTIFGMIFLMLKPKGSLYLSVKQGDEGEVIEKDSRYGGQEKFWSYYEKGEMEHYLFVCGFKTNEVVVKREMSDYNTHPIIKIFAEKRT